MTQHQNRLDVPYILFEESGHIFIMRIIHLIKHKSPYLTPNEVF